METLYIIAARMAPALASGLVTMGIAANHAEVIALGVATGVVAAWELVSRLRNKGK